MLGSLLGTGRALTNEPGFEDATEMSMFMEEDIEETKAKRRKVHEHQLDKMRQVQKLALQDRNISAVPGVADLHNLSLVPGSIVRINLPL